MTAHLEIYEEIAELLASMDPSKVLALKASPARQRRIEGLLEKNREENLTEAEQTEMERYLLFNRVVTLAKVRARRLLAHGS